MTEPLVRLERVTKTYGGRVAVDDVSLAVAPGEVVALLGPNGAGKSTILALMLGHVRPTRGAVHVHGASVWHDRRRALARVGVVPDAPAFYEYLTGWENLALLVGYAARPDPAALRDAVRFVALETRIHERVRVYSHGMRQRLALAQALVPAPDLVLLDEPAAGLDPAGIATIHRMVERLARERAVAVVMATHLLAEVEPVCDRVAILDRGRLVFLGDWRDPAATPTRVRLEIADWARARPILDRVGATIGEPGVVALPPGLAVADLVTALVEGGARLHAVTGLGRTLADVYREVTAAEPERAA